MNSIVWLASYPKSGNTWLRVFLANYVLDRKIPIAINAAGVLGSSDVSTKVYRDLVGEDLDPNDGEKCFRYRHQVLEEVVSNGADVNLVKTHYPNMLVNNVASVPLDLTRSAIYVLRNPLDVAISYADYFGLSIDSAIDCITSTNNVIHGGDRIVQQPLGSWSEHVTSWHDSTDFPLLVLRYESMLANPVEAFTSVVRHIGMPLLDDRLHRAIEFSGFDQLRAQEDTNSFTEKSCHQENFFRSGKAGDWKHQLSTAQVGKIRKALGPAMLRFGYG